MNFINMIRQLIFITLVLSALDAKCQNYCLRCDTEVDMCLFCDATQGYIAMYGRCIKMKAKHCEVPSHFGSCLHCKEGFTLDWTTGHCFRHPEEEVVENCDYYANRRDCMFCKEGFFLEGKICVEATVKIEGCMVQDQPDKCLTCNQGYTRSTDRGSCVSVSKENCQGYSFVECRDCLPGYIHNSNYYLSELFGFGNKLEYLFLETRFESDIWEELDMNNYGVCEALAVSNCLSFETANKCGVCMPGYLLDDEGECEAYPDEKIDFCVKYSDPSTCIECEQERFLKSSVECVKVETIDNCETYSPTANESVCQRCKTNFYVQESVCVKRNENAQIVNCFEQKHDSEDCLKCGESFRLTDDDKKCLERVVNCMTYVASTKDDESLECMVCKPGYYHDETTKRCVQGGIERCHTYETTSNTCAVCQNRYFLDGLVCRSHDFLNYCSQYSNSDSNMCTGCMNTAYLFQRTNACVAVEHIENCKTYATTTTCAECNDGFQLGEEAICLPINPAENCLRKDDDNCIKCFENYILDTGSCEKPVDHVVRNCASDTVDGLTGYNQLACEYCREFNIPIDYRRNFLCFEDNYIDNKLGIDMVDHCQQYKMIENTYECVKCDRHAFLFDGECESECGGPRPTSYSHVLSHIDLDGNSLNDSFSVSTINTCGERVPYCKMTSPDLDQQSSSDINYSCVVCEETAVPMMNFNLETVLLRSPMHEDDMFRLSPVSFSSPYECAENPAIAKVLGDTSDDGFVEHCNHYYNVDVGAGCLKCDHAFNGIIVDTIFQCKTYTQLNRCSECNQGYFLESPEICREISDHIDFCIKYDPTADAARCTECDDEHYLDDPASCLARTHVEHCDEYVFNLDECNECKDNYWKRDATTCTPEVINCKEHIWSADRSLIEHFSICTVCKPGYFVHDDKCVLGTVAGCEIYRQDQFNQCHFCLNGNYLSSENTCEIQTPILNCAETDNSRGKCRKCDDDYFLFHAEKQCISVMPIADCQIYSSLNTCERCQAGSYVSNDAQRCLTIPIEWNCIEYGDFTEDNNNGCIECEDGYINNGGVCENWYNTVNTNCDIAVGYVNGGFSSTRECTYCDPTFDPVSIVDEYVCVEADLIKKWAQDPSTNQVLANCKRQIIIPAFGGIAAACVECNKGFIRLNGVCVPMDQCPSDEVQVSMEVTSHQTGGVYDKLEVTSGKFCSSLTSRFVSPNLKCIYTPVIKPDTDSIVNYICSKCYEGYSAIIIPIGNYIPVAEGYEEVVSPVQSSPLIADCADLTDRDTYTVHGQTTIKNDVKNCAYYRELAGTGTIHIGCIACAHGYTGVIKHYPIEGNNHYFISSCSTPVADCDLGVRRYGLVPTRDHLDLFSYHYGIHFEACHVCTTGIPMAFVESFDSFTGMEYLLEYTADDLTAVTAEGAGDGLALECIDMTANTVKTVVNTSFPADCAMGFANVIDPTATSDSQTTTGVPLDAIGMMYVCAACAPGFKPEYSNAGASDFIRIVTLCTSITNCVAGGTSLNICEECDPDYAFIWDSVASKVDYTVCSDTGVVGSNCLVMLETQDCIICKKGFKLNDDGVCESIMVPFCDESYYNPLMHYDYAQLTYYLAPKPNGCANCTGDKLLVKNFQDNSNIPFVDHFPESQKVCVTRLPPLVETDPVIANCNGSNWKFNIQLDRYVCTLCADDFIVTKDGDCVDDTNYENCAIAVDTISNKCEKCSLGFISVAGVCKSLGEGAVIEFCDEYQDSSFKTGAVCTRCADGYYVVEEDIGGETTYSCVLYAGDIQNCIQFDATDLNHIYCTECIDDYALLILSGDQVGGIDGYERICLLLDGRKPANCRVFDLVEMTTGSLTCTECDGNALILSDAPDQDDSSFCVPIPTVEFCVEYDLDQTTGPTPVYNPADSTLKCKRCDTGYFLNEVGYTCDQRISVVSEFCDRLEHNEDVCAECEENYLLDITKLICTPSPLIGGTASLTPGNILSCREMDNCRPDFLEGLHPHIAAIASCHVCEKSNEIPTIAVRGGESFEAIIGINKYGIDPLADAADHFNKKDKGRSVFCAEPVNTSYGIAADKFNFPAHCGLAVLNTNSKHDATDSTKTVAGVDAEKIAVFCGACKPGYKATMTAGVPPEVPLMIPECTAIPNCESSRWFNYCTQCEPGYSYAYDLEHGVHYDSCVSYESNPDCYAADNASPSAPVCIFCKKGSYLNDDGYCERITPPRCRFAQFTFDKVYSKKDLNTGLFLNYEGTGCQECDTGFSGVYQNQSNFVCTESEFHATDSLEETTNYLRHCKNYYEQNGQLKCKECYENYVPIQSTRICTSDSSLANCAVASNTDFCQECKEGFVLVDRQCEAKNIDHCVTYDNNEDSGNQVCSECEEGYYLEANECKIGEIHNCLIYETKGICNVCVDGFTHMKKKDGISYCYPINKKLNCKIFNEDALQNGALACDTCVSNDFVIVDDEEQFNPTECMRFTQTPNCLVYDVQNQISNSSFECAECTPNFYLSNHRCHLRTIKPKHCSEFSFTADVCTDCTFGHFVSENGKFCLPYPTGIRGCREFDKPNECKSCRENLYLAGNQCQPVEEPIDNCHYYFSQHSCEVCLTGFHATDGQCEPITAQNCASFINASVCASCISGYGFKEEENGDKLCVQKTATDCSDSEDNFPFKCKVCLGDAFPNEEGECVAVKEPIMNCVQYSSDTVCEKCARGTALSFDQTYCDSSAEVFRQVDYQCRDSVLMEEPRCTTCSLGFFFKEGECVACPESDTCAICNYRDNQKCELCNPGFFMDVEGVCVENVIVVDDDGEDPGDGPVDGGDGPVDGGDGNSAGLVRIVSALMMILAFLW